MTGRQVDRRPESQLRCGVPDVEPPTARCETETSLPPRSANATAVVSNTRRRWRRILLPAATAGARRGGVRERRRQPGDRTSSTPRCVKRVCSPIPSPLRAALSDAGQRTAAAAAAAATLEFFQCSRRDTFQFSCRPNSCGSSTDRRLLEMFGNTEPLHGLPRAPSNLQQQQFG
jgi:hypothetical protein